MKKPETTQIVKWVWFDLEGNEHNKEGHIPPIGLLMHDDGGYLRGWYYCDEAEQVSGPFNTFEETVIAFNKYVEWLG
jgi:hypothetical protein